VVGRCRLRLLLLPRRSGVVRRKIRRLRKIDVDVFELGCTTAHESRFFFSVGLLASFCF
jgi:hypothetical protein